MIRVMETGARSPSRGSARRRRFLREESELEFARIVAFSDGVFAIAITLLVLGLAIPEGVADVSRTLEDQWPDFFAFLLSFAVLARVWVFHHHLFAAIGRFDGGLIALNFAYLALVTLVPFTSQVIGDYGKESIAAAIYALNISLLGAAGATLVLYAFRRDLVNPEIAELHGIRPGPENWILCGVFGVSLPIAAISATAAEWSWLVLLVAAGILARARRAEQPSA
jgi:TMEM175 potassium channel family protein